MGLKLDKCITRRVWRCVSRTGAVTDFAVVFMLRVVQEKHILKEINLERDKLAGQGTKCADAHLMGPATFAHPVTQ